MRPGICVCIVAAAISLAAPNAEWLAPFVRPNAGNPVIQPREESVFRCPIRKATVHWEALHTFNPAAVVRGGRIYVLYRAEDDTGAMDIGGHTSRLGLAHSEDGIHFVREPAPVLYPDNDAQKSREWPGGCEDPRLVETADGMYVMTYTQWNRKRWAAAVATSRDLTHWTKYGPILDKAGTQYATSSYKSAGIVTRVLNDRLVAAKIHGKYWMYWGEGTIRLATSNNLLDWRPVEDSRSRPVVALTPRPGRFDSSFPEVGPPPVLTERGILVLYNGKNAARGGDPNIGPNSYSGGQALFDADDPTRLIARLDAPFFRPETPFERTGQYAAGTTFLEGLVLHRRSWLLYYGAADSLVGVAVRRGL